MDEPSVSNYWSREEEKAFENAIAVHSENSPDRWEKIAAAVPRKSLLEVKHHYDLLVEDINNIEAGLFPFPGYASSPEGSADQSCENGFIKKKQHIGHHHKDSSHVGKASKSDSERRKGVAWTEDEHRLFLLGLDKYGKGDWRSISRNFVVSRTPTQVASHAQKYFIRLNSLNKERRRSSIHDITSINGDMLAPQGPITGQSNVLLASRGESSKLSTQCLQTAPSAHKYGVTAASKSITPLLGSAAPVYLPPQPSASYEPFVSVPVCTDAGVSRNFPTVAYPMHCTP